MSCALSIDSFQPPLKTQLSMLQVQLTIEKEIVLKCDGENSRINYNIHLHKALHSK